MSGVLAPEVSSSRRPRRGYLLWVLLSVVLLLLPAVVREPWAEVVSGVGGLVLLFCLTHAVVPFTVGPLQLDGLLLSAPTALGTRTLDLGRLRSVGGYQLHVRESETDYLSLRDEDGTWLVLTGQPGFPVLRGPAGAAPHAVQRLVLGAVLRRDVLDVSERGRAVLGLRARSDVFETALALSFWAIYLPLMYAALVLPIFLWDLLLPL